MLRRGVTAFFNSAQRGTNPEVTLSDFKAILYPAARAAGAEVGQVAERSVTPNFHQATLRLPDRDVVVLCNSVYPIVAFAESPVEPGTIVFTDAASLSAVFEAGGRCDVLRKAEAERRVHPSDLAALDPVEREQFEYWLPNRLGDVIFNWWD